METPSVIVIVPTLRDNPLRALRSLAAQTLRPSRVIVVAGAKPLKEFLSRSSRKFCLPLDVVYVKPDMREHIGIRVAKAINAALTRVNLEEYDYFLKLDADILLHPRCLETCVRTGADLVGLGPFMLLRSQPFARLLGGRWPVTPADDSYVKLAFASGGLRVERVPPGLIAMRKSGKLGSWKYYFLRGVDDYSSGINPLSMARIVFGLARERRTLLPVFTLAGYLCGLLRGSRRHPFASTIFRLSLKEEVERHVAKLSRLTRARKGEV